MKLSRSAKDRLYLATQTLLYTIIGGAVWLLAGRYVLPETEWFLCFMGYPAVIGGFFGGVLYLYYHEFA